MELKVPEKMIKVDVENYVDCVLHDYSDEAIKRAKPKVKNIVKAVMEDPEFILALQKSLQAEIYEELVVDAAYSCPSKILDDLARQLDQAEREISAESLVRQRQEDLELEQRELQEAIRSLEKKGYTVTKK